MRILQLTTVEARPGFYIYSWNLFVDLFIHPYIHSLKVFSLIYLKAAVRAIKNCNKDGGTCNTVSVLLPLYHVLLFC